MPEGGGALQVQHVGIAGQLRDRDRGRDPVQGGRAVDGMGKHQWPFENWLPDNADDRALLRENAPPALGVPRRCRRRPPRSAHPARPHSREILRELGRADAEIDTLIAGGTVEEHHLAMEVDS